MPEVREEAFAADTMMMATFHETGEGFRVAVKGAPEAVLEACSSPFPYGRAAMCWARTTCCAKPATCCSD
jgi:magnesium-transporting ATPase (P-type)